MNARIAIALAMLAVPAAHAGEKIKERAAADPRGEVEVSNLAGTVTVTGWDRNEVEVTGELADDAERLEFVAKRKHTLIKVVFPRDKHSHRRDSDSELNVKVPERSRVNVSTVSADITVEKVLGAQSLGTVSGDVITTVSEEEVQVRTVSGDARVSGDGASTTTQVNTVSGDAIVENLGGEITAASVSGDIDVTGETADRLEARSTSGSIRLSVKLADDARVDADTISGEIELMLGNARNAEYVIETFSGDIDNCFGPKPQRKSQYAPGSELRFTEGDGDAQVRVNTLSGSVELCDED
ncbi:MAG TPA: DUF4097 family beta strand repeat-containing protein [Gammaproteobacteria bacterium]|nr:DUF4097 family beta strand repeat-containing protein [Gammaproteobacteria bacterium]